MQPLLSIPSSSPPSLPILTGDCSDVDGSTTVFFRLVTGPLVSEFPLSTNFSDVVACGYTTAGVNDAADGDNFLLPCQAPGIKLDAVGDNCDDGHSTPHSPSNIAIARFHIGT